MPSLPRPVPHPNDFLHQHMPRRGRDVRRSLVLLLRGDAGRPKGLVVPITLLMLEDGLLAAEVYAVDVRSTAALRLGVRDHALKLVPDLLALIEGSAGVEGETFPRGLVLWDRIPTESAEDDLLTQRL
jgi:hypothetical protein